MSTQSSVQALPAKPLEVLVKGKVVHSRRHEGKYYTLVLCPAPDEWSSPARLELRSGEKLGEKDEQVSVRCRVGGFEGKPFTWTDKSTGEIKNARNVFHVLDVIA